MNYPKILLAKKNRGFTLIELIIVIILIGILAVTVVPKFITSKGFEEYTYRDELIIKLRAIQLRTMQQTNSGKCQEIKVDTANGIIGLLATDSDPSNPLCKTNDYAGDSTTVTIAPNHNVSFSISENLTKFSSLGKPLGCISLDPCKVTITIKGEGDLTIEINEEGYIYAS